jgi:2'-5' RNA ligase
MRIFIALLFPDSIKKEIFKEIEKLSENYPGNYTSYDNLHLTLHYIGEVSSSKLSEIKEAIKSIEFPSFAFETSRFGAFKNRDIKRLIHLKIKDNHTLKLLHLRVINALKLIGVKIESENFTPHITLGRKVEIALDDVNNLPNKSLKIEASRVSIMESKRVNGILVYEEIDYQALKKH